LSVEVAIGAGCRRHSKEDLIGPAGQELTLLRVRRGNACGKDGKKLCKLGCGNDPLALEQACDEGHELGLGTHKVLQCRAHETPPRLAARSAAGLSSPAKGHWLGFSGTGLTEELRNWHLQDNCQPVQQIDGGVALLSFNLTDPSPVHPCVGGELLLGKSSPRAQRPQIPCQQYPSAHEGRGPSPRALKPRPIDHRIEDIPRHAN